MDKLNCILDYFCGTKAYYMFWVGNHYNDNNLKEFILDKKYLNGAKVAFISNIMLSIKEDLVLNKGDRVYESKIFIDALENSVEFLARKVSNGYKIGNYIFPDAATLVAIIRNKLAHGNYRIDFEHNRVIINHQGNDIVLNISKLANFIVMGFMNSFKSVKTTRYQRDIVYFDRKNIDNRLNGVKDLSEIRKIIKGYNYLNFVIESSPDIPISEDCIAIFEQLIKFVKNNPYDYQNSDVYNKLCEYLKKRNCRLFVEYKKLSNNNDIDDIMSLLGDELINNSSMTFRQQVEVIGREVHKKMNTNLNKLNPITANVKHLIMLNAISKCSSVKDDILFSQIENISPSGIDFYYDEYGMVLISMFNSLFVYPMDDIYSIPGEYTLDRSNGIDFASLELSMVNPIVISIDYSPLDNAKAKVDSISSKCVELVNKINQQKLNLGKVQGKPLIEAKINASISSLNTSLLTLQSEYVVADASYTAIKNDFTDNADYFRNKAIIEGIRNSIAHGHYEFISSGNFNDTIIAFNDIYEGKLTFQAKIKFSDFERLINDNTMIISNFVNKKLGIVNGNSLSKK